MFESNIPFFSKKIPYFHNCAEFRHRNTLTFVTLEWLQV